MNAKHQPNLSRPGGRLKAARIAAKYRTAKEFADKNGIKYATYKAHERGSESGRGMNGKVAERYAEILRERLPKIESNWLLHRDGPPPFKYDGDVSSTPMNTNFMADCIEVVVEYCVEYNKPLSGDRIALAALRLYQAYEFEMGGLQSDSPAIKLYIGTIFDNE